MPSGSSLAGLKPHARPTYFSRTLSEWAPGSWRPSPPESRSCCVQRFRHLANSCTSWWLRVGQWLQELRTHPWSPQEATAMTPTGGRSQVGLDIIWSISDSFVGSTRYVCWNLVAVWLGMTSRSHDQITCDMIRIGHMTGSHDHDITIAFPLRRELRQTYGCRYECSLVKNLPTLWETGEEDQETNENILAP